MTKILISIILIYGLKLDNSEIWYAVTVVIGLVDIFYLNAMSDQVITNLFESKQKLDGMSSELETLTTDNATSCNNISEIHQLIKYGPVLVSYYQEPNEEFY